MFANFNLYVDLKRSDMKKGPTLPTVSILSEVDTDIRKSSDISHRSFDLSFDVASLPP